MVEIQPAFEGSAADTEFQLRLREGWQQWLLPKHLIPQARLSQTPEESSVLAEAAQAEEGKTSPPASSESELDESWIKIEKHGKHTGRQSASNSPALQPRKMADADEDRDFAFDEELAQQSHVKAITPPSRPTGSRYVHIQDEDSDFDDDNVSKLIIVTPSREKRPHHAATASDNHSRKHVSSQLAAAINDGLYFYEQELHTPSHKRRPSQSPLVGVATPAQLFPDEKKIISPEKSDSAAPQRHTPGKDSPILQARGSPGMHGRTTPKMVPQHHPEGGVSRVFIPGKKESDSDMIGWVLGTSPATTGMTPFGSYKSHDLSGDHPTGASPKDIPFFEHPSHALLRDNGFVQQKYQRFRARCLKGRSGVAAAGWGRGRV